MLYSAPVHNNQIFAGTATDRNKRIGKTGIPSANILVIDPDIRAIRECVQAFSERGWHVEVAESFVDALRLLEGPLYDLVLIEISLPDMLGTEAWTFIQKMNPALSAIMTTSSKSLHRSINALGEGASAYLLKPVDVQLLCNLVQQMLEVRNAETEIKRVRTRLAGLYNLFSSITYVDLPSQIYDKALAHLRAILHYDLALFYGSRPNSPELVRIASHSVSPSVTTLNESQSEFVETLARECVASLHPIVLTRSCTGGSGKGELPEDLDLESCTVVPLIGQKSIHGALAIVNSVLLAPYQEPIQIEMLAALAQVIAIALDRAFVSEKLSALE